VANNPFVNGEWWDADVNGAPVIDTRVAHAARIYDFLLGGVVNFAIDRQAAEQANVDMPGGIDRARAHVRSNRDFLRRAIRWLAGEMGVRQFLDIGTGIPNADNVHGVAQQTAASCRVVYVDNDPIVLAHAHELLKSTPEGATAFLYGDLRDPTDVLLRSGATLHFDQPIAVVLVAVLHFLDDADDPYGIVSRLMAKVPSGSYLVISHGTADIDPDNMMRLADRLSARSRETFVWRTRAEVTRFLDGLEMVEPGVVAVDEWRPDPPASQDPERLVPFYGAVGRKQ
jgi:hypothetical protein